MSSGRAALNSPILLGCRATRLKSQYSGGRDRKISQSEANLVYKGSSRPAMGYTETLFWNKMMSICICVSVCGCVCI